MSSDARCDGPDTLHLAAGQVKEQQLRHWITRACEGAGLSNASFLLGMNRARSAAAECHCETPPLGNNSNLQRGNRNPGVSWAPFVSPSPKIAQKTILVSW